jgi:putative aminopeptidase FrvX
VELVSLDDLENAAKLLAEICKRIDAKTSFIPM